VAEYNLSNGYWTVSDAKDLFFPFSRVVYLPSTNFLVIGGLNDLVQKKAAFSNQALMVEEQAVNSYESVYKVERLKSMIKKLGCFSAILAHPYINVFGGLNYMDKVLSDCEKLDITNPHAVWEEISPMVECRNNSTTCFANKNSLS
jgi:hypothetical protein